jgi:hypothetical protein
MIFLNSRYAQNPVATLVFSGDSQIYRTALRSPPALPPASFRMHFWSETDRLDAVAGSLFGDPTMWWMIADLNPEILDFTGLAPGTMIRVPSV